MHHSSEKRLNSLTNCCQAWSGIWSERLLRPPEANTDLQLRPAACVGEARSSDDHRSMTTPMLDPMLSLAIKGPILMWVGMRWKSGLSLDSRCILLWLVFTIQPDKYLNEHKDAVWHGWPGEKQRWSCY